MKFDEIYFNNKKKYIYYIYKNIYTVYTIYHTIYILYIVNSNLQAYPMFIYLKRQIKLTFGTIAQKKQ